MFFLLDLRLQEYCVTALERCIRRPDLSVKSTPHHAITDMKAFDSNLLPESEKSLRSAARYVLLSGLFAAVCVTVRTAMWLSILVLYIWDPVNLRTSGRLLSVLCVCL